MSQLHLLLGIKYGSANVASIAMIYVLNRETACTEAVIHTFRILFALIGTPVCFIRKERQIGNTVKSGDLLICYSTGPVESPCPQICIHPKSEVFSSPDTAVDVVESLISTDPPVLFAGSPRIEEHIRHDANIFSTDLDIIASTFFLLSRSEELDTCEEKRDGWARFRAEASLLYKASLLKRPLVNEYAEQLWSWITSCGFGPERKSPWGAKSFAVVLSHDIDAIQRYRAWPPVRACYDFGLKHRDLSKATRIALEYAAVRLGMRCDPYNNLRELASLEERHGFRSSFYFMAGRTGPRDARYCIEDARVQMLAWELRDAGFEVGLHASFSSYDDLRGFREEKIRLEKALRSPVYGGRQHCLRWRNPQSWSVWSEADMLYDSTVGFPELEGFRCGICHPFQPFDVKQKEAMSIWELPLTVMDQTLLKYQSLSPEVGYERIVHMLETVQRHHGVFVLLWHNSFLHDLALPGWREVYEDVLSHISRMNAFVATGEQVVRRWRSFMQELSVSSCF